MSTNYEYCCNDCIHVNLRYDDEPCKSCMEIEGVNAFRSKDEELERLKTNNRLMRKALEHYADDKNYTFTPKFDWEGALNKHLNPGMAKEVLKKVVEE